MSDKETQIDHISMLKEYDLIRYQLQHPDQFRPYVEMPRIKKDSEPTLSPNVNSGPRTRREPDRFRFDALSSDAGSLRSAPIPVVNREVRK